MLAQNTQDAPGDELSDAHSYLNEEDAESEIAEEHEEEIHSDLSYCSDEEDTDSDEEEYKNVLVKKTQPAPKRRVLFDFQKDNKLIDKEAKTESDENEVFFHEQEHSEEYIELEKETKTELSKYIKGATINQVLVQPSHHNSDDLHAEIKLQDNIINIEISEFLNSKFCKDNKITDFLILDNNREIISGYIAKNEDGKKIRCYNLTNSSLHKRELQFKWYVDERECSVALSSNSNGNIEIVGNKPSYEDLEKNTDVEIELDGKKLSLADVVKELEQQSTLDGSRIEKFASQQQQYLVS